MTRTLGNFGGMITMEPESKKKNGLVTALLVTLAMGIVFGTAVTGFVSLRGYIERKEAEMLAVDADGTENETEEYIPLTTESKVTSDTDVSLIVANCMPSIVSIDVYSVTVSYDIFGRAYEQESSGSGTGIIVAQSDSSVMIATNFHVVDGATTIVIGFVDGTTAKATLKGSDSENDIAVVAVDLADISKATASNIRIALLGNSNDIMLGERVVAIGNALGYGQSNTVGYISAIGRVVEFEDGSTQTLLQTDAAINPGNSGGALINMCGEVIGINSAKDVGEKIEGIGYAIPISKAIPILDELLNREELKPGERAYLGIRGMDAANAFYGRPDGVYVNEVNPGSPAEEAGIKFGYIITAVNGTTVQNFDEFKAVLDCTRGGTEGTITVLIFERGKYVEKVLDVTFGYSVE